MCRSKRINSNNQQRYTPSDSPTTSQQHTNATQNNSNVDQITQINKNTNISEPEVSFAINNASKKRKYALVNMLNTDCNFLIDTGLTINLIDEATFNRLNIKPSEIRANDSNAYGYGSNTALTIIGTFTSTIKYKDKSTVADFSISRGNYGCIL